MTYYYIHRPELPSSEENLLAVDGDQHRDPRPDSVYTESERLWSTQS